MTHQQTKAEKGAKTHPMQPGEAFEEETTVATVVGVNGKTYKITKQGIGEWHCSCSTPFIKCAHMRRAWEAGQELRMGLRQRSPKGIRISHLEAF